LVCRGGAVQGGRLGLPIPHTAIIQSNQDRIADKLGEFIECISSKPLRSKPSWPRSISAPHRRLAARAQERKRRSRPASRAPAAEAFSATESSGLLTFITRRLTTQLLR